MRNTSLVRYISPTEELERVRDELLDARLNFFDMLHIEARLLYKFVHLHEKILGAIRGRVRDGGSAMLVATDRRIMYLDKIPFNVKVEEISYQAVNGVTYVVGRFFSHVTLYTGAGTIGLRWVTTRAAERFIHSVELMCIENQADGVVRRSQTPPVLSPSSYVPRYVSIK